MKQARTRLCYNEIKMVISDVLSAILKERKSNRRHVWGIILSWKNEETARGKLKKLYEYFIGLRFEIRKL